MAAEVVSLLQPRPDGLYADCTIGAGGHSEVLLESGAGRVIGLDRDRSALALAGARLARWAGRVEFVHADYRTLDAVLQSRGVTAIDGALADLGVSSMQLDDESRGFSFRSDGPLDMRMDQDAGATLGDRLAAVDEATLADVIYRFGEERHSRRIARAIVQAQTAGRLARTGDLAAVVRRAAARGTWQRIDPATRTFQALRVWVNDELAGLDGFLRSAVAALAAGGRLVVIAFQSLEDRVVKQTFRQLSGAPVEGESEPAMVRVLTRKPLVPDEAERGRNPRARSARLRAVERVA